LDEFLGASLGLSSDNKVVMELKDTKSAALIQSDKTDFVLMPVNLGDDDD
jgi:hypothetical protein